MSDLGDTPPLRQSNNDLLRDLHTNLAVLSSQMAAVMSNTQTIQTQLGNLVGRQESLDREILMLRNRLEGLEQHPPGLSPESHGEIRALLKEHDQRLDTLRDNQIVMDGRVQAMASAPPILSPEETSEARRALDILRRRNWDDTFEPEETDDLRRIRTEWISHGTRRGQFRQSLLLNTLGLVGSGILFGVLIPLLTHLH